MTAVIFFLLGITIRWISVGLENPQLAFHLALVCLVLPSLAGPSSNDDNGTWQPGAWRLSTVECSALLNSDRTPTWMH